MKILLIGEYSNVHATLAEGLRAIGHDVTVLSNGDFWKNYPRDIDLSRGTGKLGGIGYLLHTATLLPRLKGYDIVQLINPMFLELKAEHITPIYKYLRRNNRNMVLGAFGMDYYWVHTCCEKKPLRYSDFNIGDKLRTDSDAMKERNDWLNTAKERLNKLIAHDADGIVTGLYEYWVCYHPVFPQKTTFIPYPIRTSNTVRERYHQETVTIFIGINKQRNTYKGTDIMLAAAKDLAAKYPQRVKLQIAESVPFDDYQRMMNHADILLDQLYSYTPSMNTLLAMSKGIVCVGGGEPENYEIIHEKELRPIINVQPCYDSVYHELEQLILHSDRLPALKQQSQEYVIKHHDYLKVAREYAAFYQKVAVGK